MAEEAPGGASRGEKVEAIEGMGEGDGSGEGGKKSGEGDGSGNGGSGRHARSKLGIRSSKTG